MGKRNMMEPYGKQNKRMEQDSQKHSDSFAEKRNYQQELDRILELQKGTCPRLLLHSCCGPCSSAVLEYLTQFFEVTLF